MKPPRRTVSCTSSRAAARGRALQKTIFALAEGSPRNGLLRAWIDCLSWFFRVVGLLARRARALRPGPRGNGVLGPFLCAVRLAVASSEGRTRCCGVQPGQPCVSRRGARAAGQTAQSNCRPHPNPCCAAKQRHGGHGRCRARGPRCAADRATRDARDLHPRGTTAWRARAHRRSRRRRRRRHRRRSCDPSQPRRRRQRCGATTGGGDVRRRGDSLHLEDRSRPVGGHLLALVGRRGGAPARARPSPQIKPPPAPAWD